MPTTLGHKPSAYPEGPWGPIFYPEGTKPDEGAIEQMNVCLAPDAGVAGVLSADHHLGYSMPIGGTIAYRGAISPSGVGYDIGCGNKAVRTAITIDEINHWPGGGYVKRVMDEIAERVGFGVGRPNNAPVDHPVLDEIADHGDRFISDLAVKAAAQLGTVGSGNHYVDLFAGDDGFLWIGVHFGSRGFGHTIASAFTEEKSGMFDPPTLLGVDTLRGQGYIEYMELAGRYAYAGRDQVINRVLDILDKPEVTHEVHNHHNFAWEEEHFGEKLWVVRKGATPLFPGQQGFVGGSMGENAVIIEGNSLDEHDNETAFAAGNAALWSAPHGAGRQMSRTEAKGKQKKRWVFPDGHVQQHGEQAPKDTKGLKKVWVTEKEGKINWGATLDELRAMGIELRGGDADEAPGAYKRLPAVIDAHSAYVDVVHQLRPIGVAMAGVGTTDPYKD